MTELRRVADWNRRKLQSPARPQGQRWRTQHSPVDCAELRASRRLQRETASPFVFVSERGSQFTVSGFRRMIERAAMGLEIKVYPTCCGMPVGLSWRMMASYQSVAGLPGAQEYPAYGEVQRAYT